MDITTFERVTPTLGSLSARVFENENIGLEPMLFFDIQISLQPFQFKGEEVVLRSCWSLSDSLSSTTGERLRDRPMTSPSIPKTATLTVRSTWIMSIIQQTRLNRPLVNSKQTRFRASYGSFMRTGIIDQCEVRQGSRLEVRRRSLYFGQCRLLRLGQSTVRSGGDDSLGRWLVQNTSGPGTAVERRHGRAAASTHASPKVECCYRLAPATLLRKAVPESQRILLRQAQTENDEVSRLRLGLHRGVWTALHLGLELGPPSRVDGPCAAAVGGKNPRNWPENQARAAGSDVFQWGSRCVSARRESPLRDACGHPWAQAERGCKVYWPLVA